MNTSFQLVERSGDPEVAFVHVGRVRGAAGPLIEVVDGLDPPAPRHEKWIVNVSTQVGCPVGCPFCDAGGGYRGNLNTSEILAQLDYVLGLHPADVGRCQKLKIHFARMGEPGLNDAVLEALCRLPGRDVAPGLWACVATVLPRGRDAWRQRLREIKEERFRGRFQLQLSLNSTNQKTRQRLIPYPHLDLEAIATYGESFFGPGDRKVVLNFALAKDVAFDPALIHALFDPGVFAVKLTPVNPTQRGRQSGFRTLLRSQRAARLEEAMGTLEGHGFDVVASVGDPREDEVGSNCGQAVSRLRRRARHGAA